MKNRILHPLWVHIPAVLALIVFIICLFVYAPYPAQAPVHFGANGVPDRTGSPWEVIIITLVFSVFFIGLSVFLDELWSKQEKKKTFNWFTMLDEIVAGAMIGFTIDYLQFLESGVADYQVSWGMVGIVAGIATALVLILEWLRPYYPHEENIITGEKAKLKTAVSQKVKSNSPFVFWDVQNPFYMSMLTILLPVIMIVSAILSWQSQLWVSLLLIGVGLLMVIPYGGQRTMVTRQNIQIRWGLPGFKVLNIDMNDITSVSQREFSPLKDFGGYGIRFNREMKAYFLRGSVGVVIETNNGSKYLIGSDSPEDLFTAINTVVENS